MLARGGVLDGAENATSDVAFEETSILRQRGSWESCYPAERRDLWMGVLKCANHPLQHSLNLGFERRLDPGVRRDDLGLVNTRTHLKTAF